jgi:hypothetical protein
MFHTPPYYRVVNNQVRAGGEKASHVIIWVDATHSGERRI